MAYTRQLQEDQVLATTEASVRASRCRMFRKTNSTSGVHIFHTNARLSKMYGVQTSDARGMRFWMFFRFQRFGLESLQFGQIRVISRLLVIGQEEGNMQMLLYVSFKCALLDQKK